MAGGGRGAHAGPGIRFHMLQRHARYTRELEVEIEVVVLN